MCGRDRAAGRHSRFAPSPLVVMLTMVLALAAAGCGTRRGGGEALQTPASKSFDATGDYIIGPLDKLNLRVFAVKDLSLDGIQVDASGQLVLPLLGAVKAEGKTAEQLSQLIAARLGERYLQSPQVSVTVVDSASQKVTVDGGVKSPGVFAMRGRTTLMQAVAMGGGMSDTADLHKVAIIRVVDGRRSAAISDYAAISEGKAADPEILGDDVVVVDSSMGKSVWQDMLKTLPLFSLLAVVA